MALMKQPLIAAFAVLVALVTSIAACAIEPTETRREPAPSTQRQALPREGGGCAYGPGEVVGGEVWCDIGSTGSNSSSSSSSGSTGGDPGGPSGGGESEGSRRARCYQNCILTGVECHAFCQREYPEAEYGNYRAQCIEGCDDRETACGQQCG